MAGSSSKTFTIDWVPPTLNQYCRAHWRKQREWVGTAGLMIASKIGGRMLDSEQRRMRVTIQFYRTRPTDRDNATPKVILDALNRLGWIHDDSEKWCEQVVKPVIVGRNPKTEITLEPYSPSV